jgi:hypothetical protein
MNKEQKYIVYKITIPQTNKNYIGITMYNVEKRFTQHVNLSKRGEGTYFCRALRKYECDDISKVKTEILYETNDRKDVCVKEKYYIEYYDTLKTGYNSTLGGDGGDVCSHLEEEARNSFLAKLSANSTGASNSNHSGYTDEELIQAGADMYNEKGYFSIGDWLKLCDLYGYPKNFSKNRFGGKQTIFKQLIADKLGLTQLQKYLPTAEHRANLSEVGKTHKWFNDGVKNYRATPENIHEFENNPIYQRGFLCNKKKWFNDGVKSYFLTDEEFGSYTINTKLTKGRVGGMRWFNDGITDFIVKKSDLHIYENNKIYRKGHLPKTRWYNDGVHDFFVDISEYSFYEKNKKYKRGKVFIK